MIARLRVLLALFSAAAACAAQDESTRASGGSGGSGGASSEKGSGADEPASTSTGSSLTCDDMGFCGEVNDPGCQGCAYTIGSCVDAFNRCEGAPGMQCFALNQCLIDCAEVDVACQNSCADQFPSGVDPLTRLSRCIFCDECPVSCATDPAMCTP
jgi:hypothetical protein